MTDDYPRQRTRKVEGGYVDAERYPTAGEPDWKAEAERLRAELAAARLEVADALIEALGWRRKAREASPDANPTPNPENAPTGQPGPFKAKSKRGRK